MIIEMGDEGTVDVSIGQFGNVITIYNMEDKNAMFIPTDKVAELIKVMCGLLEGIHE